MAKRPEFRNPWTDPSPATIELAKSVQQNRFSTAGEQENRNVGLRRRKTWVQSTSFLFVHARLNDVRTQTQSATPTPVPAIVFSNVAIHMFVTNGHQRGTHCIFWIAIHVILLSVATITRTREKKTEKSRFCWSIFVSTQDFELNIK